MTKSKPKSKTPSVYRYARDRDGVDDTFDVYHPNGEPMVTIRFWGGDDPAEERFAEFRAKLVVDTLNEGYWWHEGDAAQADPSGRARDCGEPAPEVKGCQVPADPERMNDKRSAWAAAAIFAFRDVTGTDADDALTDLLADLMHWADRHGQDFDRAFLGAKGHYAAETTEVQP